MEILNMTFDDFYEIEPIYNTEFDDFWKSENLKSELANENSKYIVAKENDFILGFAGVWFSVDDAHITNLVVRKNYRNKKIGSALLKELINLSKEKNSLTLEVNVNNIIAQNLYNKFGFKNLGIRKKYYNGTQDAYIMTLYY